MKKLILISVVLVISCNLSIAQKALPLSSFEDFHLRMSEKDFREVISSKYEICGEGTHNQTHFHDKSVKLQNHNLHLKFIMIKTPGYKLGNTGLICDYFNFLFLNDRLYEISFWTPDYKLSDKKVDLVIRYLTGLYASQFKATMHNKPNNDVKVFSGHYVMHSEPLINNKLSDIGTVLNFRYRVKNKYKSKADNKIYLVDNEAEYYWKYHVLMTEDFEKKEFKAYNAFRDVNLGESMSRFLNLYGNEVFLVSDSTVERAYKDNPDVDVYLMHDVYVDANPEPLPNVPLSEVDYFFYDGLLSTIRLSLDSNVDIVKFESLLNEVYGPASEIDDDGNSLRTFVSYNESLKKNSFQYSLRFFVGSEEYPPALIFRSDFLFSKCKNEFETKKAETLKSAF